MSAAIMENLIKFITINSERIEKGLSSLCKNEKQETIRKDLPCDVKDDKGEYTIKCENCPFSSAQAGRETVAQLGKITSRYKTKNILLGIENT